MTYKRFLQRMCNGLYKKVELIWKWLDPHIQRRTQYFWNTLQSVVVNRTGFAFLTLVSLVGYDDDDDDGWSVDGQDIKDRIGPSKLYVCFTNLPQHILPGQLLYLCSLKSSGSLWRSSLARHRFLAAAAAGVNAEAWTFLPSSTDPLIIMRTMLLSSPA